jgi:hypothetical protein
MILFPDRLLEIFSRAQNFWRELVDRVAPIIAYWDEQIRLLHPKLMRSRKALTGQVR